MRWLILTQMFWLLGACENIQQPAIEKEPWPTEAEVVFQQEAVLRYELDQQQRETKKLQSQGIDGSPPSLRR